MTMIIILTFMSISQLLAENPGDTLIVHQDNCSGSNGITSYVFQRLGTDTVKFTTIAWCDNNEFPFAGRWIEPYFKGFHYSGNLINVDSCTYVLINSHFCSGDTNTHIYLQEVYDQSPHYIGLIYGSADYSHSEDTTNKLFTSFVFDFSESDPYAAGYTSPELSYVREFTAGDSSYLDRIFDNDRSLLVGIRYYSATNSNLVSRFFKPNN